MLYLLTYIFFPESCCWILRPQIYLHIQSYFFYFFIANIQLKTNIFCNSRLNCSFVQVFVVFRGHQYIPIFIHTKKCHSSHTGPFTSMWWHHTIRWCHITYYGFHFTEIGWGHLSMAHMKHSQGMRNTKIKWEVGKEGWPMRCLELIMWSEGQWQASK